MKVNLFVTCLADTFFPGAVEAARSVLERLGLKVHCPLDQTCCGQPMFNAGYFDQSRVVARHFLKVFGDTAGPIVVPSSSCAAMVREHYGRLFQGEPDWLAKAKAVGARTFELTEFLVKELKADLARMGARLDGSVTYHQSCHFRGLGIRHEPESLIRQIRGLEYLPLPHLDRCCGFGGTFSLSLPHVSGSMTADKVKRIRETGAERLVFADAGCALNITGHAHRAGTPIEALHIAELIRESLGDHPGGER